MKGKGRLFLIFNVLIALVVLFAKCMGSDEKAKVTKPVASGSVSCRQCHQKIYDNYLKNPHALTSHAISSAAVLGSHALPDHNEFVFDAHVKVRVEKRRDSLFQVAYFDGNEELARSFDIAIGSGTHAFTYGSWRGEKITQLPLSYFKSINSWANSPGFPPDRPNFGRLIDARCLECHTSYVDPIVKQSGSHSSSVQFKKSSLVYGINCQRCHGATEQHVSFHIAHPKEKQGKFVTVYQKLSRKQKIDACSVCHSGADFEERKSSFAFQPGDALSDYRNVGVPVAGSEPDVHGSQSLMLAKSKCFIKSNDMDCATCHSMHEPEKDGLTMYSKKCISCHTKISHTEKTLKNALVKTNCVNCHMPLQSSKLISFKQAGQSGVSPYNLHTHHIAIYQ